MVNPDLTTTKNDAERAVLDHSKSCYACIVNDGCSTMGALLNTLFLALDRFYAAEAHSGKFKAHPFLKSPAAR
jgi:hypothetical protein